MFKEILFEKIALLAGAQLAPLHILQISIEADLAERDHDLYFSQSCKLAVKKMRTLEQLFRKWLVVGRSAAHRGGNVQIFQPEPVIAVRGVGLTCKSGFIQHR